MKKIKLLGMIISVMFLWFVGQPMEAHAKEYWWATRDGVTGWYEVASEYVLMENPPEKFELVDSLYIAEVPNEEVQNMLENFEADIQLITVSLPWDESIVIGKVGGNLKSHISVNSGKVTYNGYAKSILLTGAIVNDEPMACGLLNVNGDVKEVDISYAGVLNINGNVELLQLGHNQWTYQKNVGEVTVTGNVENVVFCKNKDGVGEQYDSYIGDCTVTGHVNGGTIIEPFYDEAIKKYIFCESGEIGRCAEGTFAINNGVLANTVVVTEKEPVLGEYYNIYTCINHNWKKQYYKKSDNLYVSEEICTKDDIPEGADVSISSCNPIIFEMNLRSLKVSGDNANVTLNGNLLTGVEGAFDDSGVLSISPYRNGEFNVAINGDVPIMTVNYRYNPQVNVTIAGKVTSGTIYIVEYEETRFNQLKQYFDCENVQLIKDGVWNKNVFVRTTLEDNAIAYQMIDEETLFEAVGDATIGEEISSDYTTYVKSIGLTIKQTSQDVMDSIVSTDAFGKVVDAIVTKEEEQNAKSVSVQSLCAAEINVKSFYRAKGYDYIHSGYGTTSILELPEGNTLEFTVKVPKAYYNEDSRYTIICQHENTDGSVVMEQLETTQNGDVLTFASDKFSTFVIVEVVEEILKDTGIIITNADGTIVKKSGIDESSGKYSFSGLVAGVYKLNVTRSNYVSRTYTVEVKTDSEKVELDIKLHKTGDITGDNTINARDKKMLYNHIAGTATLEDYDFAVGDVTGDGTLNARDKKMIYNHIAGTSSLWE